MLLGLNGTGKTTLLNLIAKVFSWNFAGLEEEEFDLAYEFWVREPETRIQVSVSHTEIVSSVDPLPAVSHEQLRAMPMQKRYSYAIRLELSGKIEDDSYTVVFEADRHKLSVSSGTHQKSVENTGVGPFGDFVVMIHPFMIDLLAWRMTVPLYLLFELTPVWRLDESLDWFREVVKVDFHFVQTTQQTSHSRHNDGQPPTLVTELLRILDNEFRPPTIATREESLGLQAVVNSLGLQKIQAYVDLKTVEERDEITVISYGNLRFYITTRDGSRIPFDQLSFGQKRLFAYFYYLSCHPHVLIADELTNGLHHQMIETCMDAMGDRQAFLATQSPLLLDFMGFDSAEEVRHSFIICETELEEIGARARERMKWRSFTEEEAHNFYQDYGVGIQHINEILRARGLW